jgi:hypothetical protein
VDFPGGDPYGGALDSGQVGNRGGVTPIGGRGTPSQAASDCHLGCESPLAFAAVVEWCIDIGTAARLAASEKNEASRKIPYERGFYGSEGATALSWAAVVRVSASPPAFA